jgi:hypothetical protein
MHWREAFEQLAVIHAQVLKGELTHTFRAAPTAATGALALAIGAWQVGIAPPHDAASFAWQWIAAAALCALLCGTDVVLRLARASRDERRRGGLALAQLLPALGVGAALTAERLARSELYGLPALWCALFGVALFSARPYLPRGMAKVALFYLGGALALLASDTQDLRAQALGMGALFGAGQIASALAIRRAATAPQELRA